MSRRNLFESERLLLDYSLASNSFELRRWSSDNEKYGIRSRRYHTAQGAYDLVQSIQQEMLKKEHQMKFNLQTLVIGKIAKKKILKYEVERNNKNAKNNPTRSRSDYFSGRR